MCPAIDGQNTAGLGYIDYSKFKPPLEMEVAFIAPDDTQAWNFWHSFGLTDTTGKGHSWGPGIQNIPGKDACLLMNILPMRLRSSRTVM